MFLLTKQLKNSPFKLEFIFLKDLLDVELSCKKYDLYFEKNFFKWDILNNL
jgi:hypothetical protein